MLTLRPALAGNRYRTLCGGGTIEPWREPLVPWSWRCCLAQQAARVHPRTKQRAGRRPRRTPLTGRQACRMPTCAGAAVVARRVVSRRACDARCTRPEWRPVSAR
jgi:hypothetical protein